MDGLELSYRWGDQLLDVAHFPVSAPVLLSDGRLVNPPDVGETARFCLGALIAELRLKPTPPPARGAWQDRIDNRFLQLLVLVAVFTTGFTISVWNRPADADVVADDLVSAPPRILKLVLQSPPATKRLIQAVLPSARTTKPGSERHAGTEGRAGSREAPPRSAMGVPRLTGIDARGLLGGSLPSGLRSGSVGLAGVFGESRLDGDVRSALGHLSGPTFGVADGLQGLGERHDGPGGAGTGIHIGLDRVNTLGRGGGLKGYGVAEDHLGGKETPQADPPTVGPHTIEAFDKELVRKVIHAHRAEVRYCYEQELQRAPSLAGKVAVTFTISAEGTVQSATVDRTTTLNNSAVEQCVLRRIGSWLFPKPKAGGVVVVTYPFLFHSAGE